MVAYLPESNRIVVSNEGDGSCKVFDADTYKLIDTVKFSDDADQLRYDPVAKRVYVGYGDGEESAIVVTNVDALRDRIVTQLVGIIGKLHRIDQLVRVRIEDLARAVPLVRDHNAVRLGKVGHHLGLAESFLDAAGSF